MQCVSIKLISSLDIGEFIKYRNKKNTETLTKQENSTICKKCNGVGKPSKAIINRLITSEYTGNIKETLLIDVIKCSNCRHSWKN